MKAIADPNGIKIVNENTYDLSGNDIRQTVLMEYNLNGNLIKATNPDGKFVTYEYDNMGRLSKTILDDNNYSYFEYNDNGNRSLMRDVKDGYAIDTTYSYDCLDRLTQFVQDGSSIGYEYDDSGNNIKTYYTSGAAQKNIEYIYDSFNRLNKIKYNGSVVKDYSYTPSGKVDYTNTYLKFDTGEAGFVRKKYNYNNIGLTVGLTYLENNAVKKEDYTLSYDKRGYLTEEEAYSNYGTEKTVQKDYQYDEIGRLLSVANSAENNTTRYTYDNVGNRLTLNDGKNNYSYSYNELNHLTEIRKDGKVDSSFEYDASGNQSKEIVNGITTSFTYDKLNRLTALTSTDGTTTTTINNQYNGDGQRIRMSENGVVTKYYYDSGSLIYTSDANNNREQEHILDPSGTIVASKRFDGNYANMFFFYNYDSRGSVSNILKPDGTAVKSYDYDEFGKTKEKGETGFKNEVKYTGAVHDAAANIYYMNSRFYNPNTGRFLTQDTYSGNAYEPWTQHLYNYCSNNPTNFIDPTGHRRESIYGDEDTSPVAPPNRVETPAPKRNNSSPQHETAKPVVESSGSNIVDRGCKVATGSLMTYLGYGALTLGFAALSVATGGLATIIALGVIGAGATTMLFGANEVIEGVTDYNPLRAGANNLGMSDEDYYLALSFASSASMAGTYYYSSGAGKSVNNSSAKGAGKSISQLNSKPLYRTMSEGELNAVKETGVLRGGRPGETFFTDSYYKNANNTQNRLSLPSKPDYIMEFKITNNPNISGGTTIKPNFGGLGGGREYFSTDPISVEIINYQKMIK